MLVKDYERGDTGMAINMDTLVESILQRPLVSGMPLYLRVDGGVDMHGQANMGVDNGWKQEASRRCTSPDNVRRVFITCKGVKKHLFLPLSKGESLESSGSYDNSILEDIDERLGLLVRGVQTPQMLQMREDNMGAGQPKLKFERMTGFGFGALQKAHVYQNVEEIYIDNILFLGFSSKLDSDFASYMRQVGSPDEALKQAFIKENAANVLELTSRFKRLHTLAYIENLSDIYEIVKSKSQGVKSYGQWLPEFAQIMGGKDRMQAIAGKMIVCKMQEGTDWRTQWSIKEGTYVFDRDKLKRFADDEDVKRRKQIQNEREEALNNEPKHEAEVILDIVYSKGNKEETKATIIAMLKLGHIRLDDIQRFSRLGKEKYGQMFSDIRSKASQS